MSVSENTWLALDAEHEVERITDRMRSQLRDVLKRRGVVVALSGGIDSSVVAALAVRALGPGRVFGLLMPEKDSDELSKILAERLVEQLGIESHLEDISPTLTALGCYDRRDAAIRSVVPSYQEDSKAKLVINRGPHGGFHYFSVIIQDPNGNLSSHHLSHKAYLEIVAATNFKQRVRKMMEYYHADRLNYAVCGTPNKLEYDQGFFVKHGDGSADLKPIVHLFKSQVYKLAEALNIPDEILLRPPTTDTYSLPQSQEEFFFSVPYRTLDLCLYGYQAGIGVEELSEATELSSDELREIFADIEIKRRTTQYLHMAPLTIDS